MSRKPNIAIVGATGMVGTTFLKVLEERKFPYDKVYMLAAPEEDGDVVKFDGREYRVEGITDQSFDGKDIDIALFSAGGGPSEHLAPIATAHGILVVDNSSQWRMDPDVPLVVPEVNPQDALTAFDKKMIIANPNCSTIQAMVVLKPLQDKYGLKRVVYSTYQAVSGSGVKGTHELAEGMKGNDLCVAYPHPIAGNCLPHIDVFEENGYTKEEMKMIDETHKILGDDNIAVTATTVRVPVFDSHSESINIELKTPFEVEDVKKLFASSPGLVLQDDPANNVYPLARSAAGTDEVYVGRVRRDFSIENGLNLWCVADNIRKGAATNTVQIAQLVIDRVTA
ncbi:MAG: aspartate-semialdehyde dehydrogenase [Clostridiales Family XIII bacterium]|jgi:aspartate-semialdehyde dehydrogenase|nr:aspartate-semialdehyde dehydrogenase [Clostridiales Family XIII bacterium]